MISKQLRLLNLLYTFLTTGIIFALATSAFAQNIEENVSNFGTIDWSNRIIHAKGVASPDSGDVLAIQRARTIEKAKQAAYQNLIQIIKEIRIHGDLVAGDLLARDKRINERLQLVARHFTVEDIQKLASDEIEVSISLPIYGALSDLLMVKSNEKGEIHVPDQPLCPVCGQFWPEGKLVPDDIKLITPWSGLESDENIEFSGLIIDARGLELKAALASRIFSTDGQEVYSTEFANRRYAIEIGLMGFSKDATNVNENNRVKSNPLFVKATGISGTYGSDIKISAEDARIVHGSALNKNFFQRCRVLVIID